MRTIKSHRKAMLVTLTAFYLALAFSSKAQEVQQTNITGHVLESKQQTGLAGATIHLDGSTNTVTTDDKGAFKLTTYKKPPYTLSISFVGYQAQELKITGNDPVTITLAELSNQLTDVAVVGYGTQRRKDVTGSIATIPKENLAQVTPSFDNLLQQRVSEVHSRLLQLNQF